MIEVLNYVVNASALTSVTKRLEKPVQLLAQKLYPAQLLSLREEMGKCEKLGPKNVSFGQWRVVFSRNPRLPTRLGEGKL